MLWRSRRRHARRPRGRRPPLARTTARRVSRATTATLWPDELADLRTTTAPLKRALASRIVIEQAKGVISVTHRVDVDRAFEILRGYARSHHARSHHARSHHARIHDVAAAVVNADLNL